MPIRILRSYRVRWAIGIFMGYWLLSIFVRPVPLAQALTIILICVAFGVVVKYSHQVWQAVLEDDRGPISQLSQGIFLAFTGLLIGLIWAMIARIVPGSEWMQRTPVIGFYILCYIVAGTLHMTARRNDEGNISHHDIRDVLVAYGIGLSVSLILMILQLGGVLREP